MQNPIRCPNAVTLMLILTMAPHGFAEAKKEVSPPVESASKAKEKETREEKTTPKETTPSIDTAETADVGAEEAESSDSLGVISENTIDMCQDNEDNDADSHVDCDDQDCEIFAICVSPPAENPPSQTTAAPTQITVAASIDEQGLQCRDGIDNDVDGLIDCYDAICSRSNYCKRIMYERPEPANKPPGLIINAGFGAAFPNFRTPAVETTWIDLETGDHYDNVPFDPDMGVMLDFQIGYLFLPWFGAGIGLKSAFTFASNRELYFTSSDDEDDYKYVGSKFYGNVGAFLRGQWPVGRVVPFINAHFGYSVYQATWHVYDPDNTWSDIDDYEVDDDNYIVGERTEIRSDRNRHFTFALEPGVDIFVVKRMFGIGIKTWLPVVASKNSEADNIGIIINMVFTPIWREPPQLKPEYSKKR